MAMSSQTLIYIPVTRDALDVGVFTLELLLQLVLLTLKLASWPVLYSHFMPVAIQRRIWKWKQERQRAVLPTHPPPLPPPHSQSHWQHPCSLHHVPFCSLPSVHHSSFCKKWWLIPLCGVLSWNTSICLQLLAEAQSPLPRRRGENAFSDLTTREQ